MLNKRYMTEATGGWTIVGFPPLFHKRHTENLHTQEGDTSLLPGKLKTHSKGSRIRKIVFVCMILLILWLISVMIYHTHKPLPKGISYESPLY